MKKSVILSTNNNVLANIGTGHMQNGKKHQESKLISKLNFKDQIRRIRIKSQCQIKCFGESAGVNKS